MKKRLLFLVFLGVSVSSFSQDTTEILAGVEKFRKELDHHYQDTATSPLKDEEALKFPGHKYYPIDLEYRVTAKLIRSKREKPFQIKTSSTRTKEYIKYGELHFELKGKKFKLNVYQSIALRKEKEYKNHLFLPFTDLTSGEQTYGGGRYIDLEIPKGKELVLDFNLAYYPYCAYTTGFSCPIPPPENFVDMKIEAGIKGQVEDK